MKPLKDWTLAECAEYCRERREKNGYRCEKKGCFLEARGICNDWMYEWHLERLTADEITLLKLTRAKWLSKNPNKACSIEFWKEKPTICPDDGLYHGIRLGFLPPECFPSVHPGDCICVEETEY